MQSQKQRSSSLTKVRKKQSQISIGQNDVVQEKTKKKKTQIIRLGVCAMKKKTESKPMREILKRLSCPQIQIVIMHPYLEVPIENWPIVDALICFFSDGFPYLKAWRYVKRHKPYTFNNLQKQQYLWDRTVVYDILKKHKIPIAKHFFVFRDLNYLNQIERICFGEELEGPDMVSPDILDSQRRSNSNEIKGQFNERESKFQKQSTQSHERDSGNKSSENQKQGQEEKTKKKHLLKANSERQQCISKASQSEFHANNNKPQGNFYKNNRHFPHTLRKFHESRMNKIQDYELQQIDDKLIIRGKQTVYTLHKPFVQKPFYAEDHQIAIYYPQSMGGGRKMLFRKVKNSSSTYQQSQNQIRRDGNYIYEQFLPTNAFDIKVYTIGPYYMYAEARKSPTLDGVVQRSQDGKQKRYPIILTPQQKFIAQKIVQAFGQDVCGFDMLRANGKSFVCDVNGWSFVKNNSRYWDDCATILRGRLMTQFFPDRIQKINNFERFQSNQENEYRPSIKLQSQKMQLRSIVCIFRHGARSPKQKLKISTKDERFLAFFDGADKKQLKFKDAKNLTKILHITNSVIAQLEDISDSQFIKFGHMKSVLESGGHFEGLNRKLQLKVTDQEPHPDKPGKMKVKQILIVLKWGGQLTNFGFEDALDLGTQMRHERYQEDKDFISLHSSYRHDLKTYSSDQGRCIKTAASFLKGFLNIEGGLAPIITTMVNSNKKAERIFNNKLGLLDCTSQQNHSNLSDLIKSQLSLMLNSDEPLIQTYSKFIDVEDISQQMLQVVKEINKPRQKLIQMHKKIIELSKVIQNQQIAKWHKEQKKKSTEKIADNLEFTKFQKMQEEVIIIYKRWSKLQKDFYSSKEKKFNISKIPQIYDTIRHDIRNNHSMLSQLNFDLQSFLELSRLLAKFVVPNQYGIKDQQKLSIALDIVSPLAEKILSDLLFWKTKNYEDGEYWKYKNKAYGDDWRHIRTRLYFTSASHMYSLVNFITLGQNRQLLKLSTPENQKLVRNMIYLSYLSHIQFRLYENINAEKQDPARFRLELTISDKYRKGHAIQQVSLGRPGFTIDEIAEFVQKNLQVSQKKKQRTSNYESDYVPTI